MDYLKKEVNEQLAIDCLKKYDTRYKNLVKSERPDFISEKDSIGVEVTIVDFDNFINSFKYAGKTLYEYIKMKGIKPIQKKELTFINEIIKNNHSDEMNYIVDDLINDFYYKKGNKILKLESVEEYRKLDPNTNLYEKSKFPNERNIIDQKIIIPLTVMNWTGQIVAKYIDAIMKKNKKFINYKKFNENSLLLINFTSDLEETLELKKRIKEIKGINFDKIFVFNPQNDIQIYEIDLNKF